MSRGGSVAAGASNGTARPPRARGDGASASGCVWSALAPSRERGPYALAICVTTPRGAGEHDPLVWRIVGSSHL